MAGLPDPGRACSLDEIAAQLRHLKVWAGAPSYDVIAGRVNEARPASERVGRSTVVDCFRAGRRRVDPELLASVVAALHPDPGYVNQWRQALKILAGTADAAHQARVRPGLPEESGTFTGRTEVLDRWRRSAAPFSLTMQGMAGVGKTRLALRLARLLLDDGVVDEAMFVDLRGFHESQAPADPAAVLDGLLRLLGVPGAQVPVRRADRDALYRRRIVGRRLLLVLDDAAHEEQVAPFLPAASGGVVLVTSRRTLTLPGTVNVEVDPFTPAESRAYLREALGLEAADPLVMDRIARRCGHLPLALALAAGRMRARPGWTLSEQADRLDERCRTGRFEPGIALPLEVSYRNLPPAGRRLLRALALHPGPSFDTAAAVALGGQEPAVTTALLNDLTDQHLLRRDPAGRFSFHHLIRTYAAAAGVDEDRRADRRQALDRLLDHCLTTASVDVSRLEPGSGDAAGAEARPGAWTDTELAGLVATAELPASTHDRPDYASDLSVVLHRYLGMRGFVKEALSIHTRAAENADRTRQAAALLQLAMTELRRSGFPEALAHLNRAERIYRHDGDEAGLLTVLSHRALAQIRVGHAQQARYDLVTVLAARRRLGDGPATIRTLHTLAGAEYGLGRYQEAAENLREALTLARHHGDRWLQAVGLCNLGGTELRLGRLDAAATRLEQALDLARRERFVSTEGCALQYLGDLHLERGDHASAETAYRRALPLLTGAGHRSGELSVHIGLGHVALAVGDPDAAVAEFSRADEGARESAVVDIEQQALAQAGLGRALHRLGREPEAARHEQQARRLWARLNQARGADVSGP